jgi:hypothetical protein
MNNYAKTALDWKADHARDLEVMRANTEQWIRDGIVKTPKDVRVRAGKSMSANPGAKVRKVK